MRVASDIGGVGGGVGDGVVVVVVVVVVVGEVGVSCYDWLV
jgi:hypothetical protein